MTRSLADLAQGTRVFIDANIFVYHVSAGSRLNQACADFLRRVEQGLLTGITSAAVVQETSHRVMMAEALLTCPHVKGKDLVRHLKTHPDIVKTLRINLDMAATMRINAHRHSSCQRGAHRAKPADENPIRVSVQRRAHLADDERA